MLELWKNQITDKERQREIYRKEYLHRAQENVAYTSEYQTHVEKMRLDKRRREATYRSGLDAQVRSMAPRPCTLRRADGGPLGLIPGINNLQTIGTRPTCRVGHTIATDIQNYAVYLHSYGQQPPAGKPESRAAVIPRKNECAWMSYNPITNPIPCCMQNPYLRPRKARSISNN